MLVLTRRAGESVMIGSDVTVRVIEIRGDVVRIGVDAPREVQVHREEVFHAVRAANLEAAAASSPGSLDALRAGLAGLGGSGAAASTPPDPSTAPSAPATGAPAAAQGPGPAAAPAPRPGPRAPQP